MDSRLCHRHVSAGEVLMTRQRWAREQCWRTPEWRRERTDRREMWVCVGLAVVLGLLAARGVWL